MRVSENKADCPRVEIGQRWHARIAHACGRAARDSRMLEYAWPAFVFVGLDWVIRGEALLGQKGQLGLYGQNLLLMALFWGAIGGLFGAAMAQVRRGRYWLGLFALLPAVGMATLAVLGVSRLSFYFLNRYFPEPAMLRTAWALGPVLVSYLQATPGVVVSALAAAGLVLVGIFVQAWLRARSAPSVSLGAVALWSLGIVWPLVSVLAGAQSRSVLDPTRPPDLGALYTLVEASLLPNELGSRQWYGAFVREPLAVPALERGGSMPNVLVILSESIRADEMCSEPAKCRDELLDPVAAERMGLERLRTQAPGTFITCMVLWTGLEPDTEYPDSHRAPFLWEVARAVGYHTIYVTAQSSNFLGFGLYVQVAGVDHHVTAEEVEPGHDVAIGAADENAMARLLAHVRALDKPWYGVLHLANTHAFYRTDPTISPFQPETAAPEGDLSGFRNRYRNAIALQRRSLAEFLRGLKALPSWQKTLVVFLSDHGEPLGDHGEVFHLNGLYEESMHVPGWVLAGEQALSPEQRLALSENRARYVYARDLHATVLDALGVWEQRKKIPYAGWQSGRSLLRPMASEEPIAVFANVSGLWGLAVPHYGVAKGPRKLLSGPNGPFHCYDLDADPRELRPAAESACGDDLVRFAHRRFPNIRR